MKSTSLIATQGDQATLQLPAYLHHHIPGASQNEWARIPTGRVNDPHALASGSAPRTLPHADASNLNASNLDASDSDLFDLDFGPDDLDWAGDLIRELKQLPTPRLEASRNQLNHSYDYDRGCFMGLSSFRYPRFALNPVLQATTSAVTLQQFVLTDTNAPMPDTPPVSLPTPPISLPTPPLSDDGQCSPVDPLQDQSPVPSLPSREQPRQSSRFSEGGKTREQPLPESKSRPSRVGEACTAIVEELRPTLVEEHHAEQSCSFSRQATPVLDVSVSVKYDKSEGGKVKKGKAPRQKRPRDAKHVRSHAGYPQPIALSNHSNTTIVCQIPGCTMTLAAGRASITKHILGHHASLLDGNTETEQLKCAISCPWPNEHGLSCGRAPIKVGNLGRHILDVHLALSKWKCPICDLIMTVRRDSVQRHIRDTCCARKYQSTDGKPPQCDLECVDSIFYLCYMLIISIESTKERGL